MFIGDNKSIHPHLRLLHLALPIAPIRVVALRIRIIALVLWVNLARVPGGTLLHLAKLVVIEVVRES